MSYINVGGSKRWQLASFIHRTELKQQKNTEKN